MTNATLAQDGRVSTAIPILEIRDLRVDLVGRPPIRVVDTVSMSLDSMQALGVVGESGSGKTMLCRALIGTLYRHGARRAGGAVSIAGQDMTRATESAWRLVRGRIVGYVPQSSLVGLNPVLSVETQLVDAIRAARAVSKPEARRLALELLELVRIPRATRVLELRPASLSGGMHQRVVIASAVAQHPRILIADEPTTALDVSVEREILALLDSLRREMGMALVLVSHDLSVVERICDSMMVMYAGASVEIGRVEDAARAPAHPYTRGLLAARLERATPGEVIETVPGDAVTVGAWPEGCRFWPRCSYADDLCRRGAQPPLKTVAARRLSACIHADRVLGTAGE